MLKDLHFVFFSIFIRGWGRSQNRLQTKYDKPRVYKPCSSKPPRHNYSKIIRWFL